ncbi:hypothetical protein KC322_g4957 [Hortaea werneckii]|nr:hypothetical protein KC322_g4957 [Hortaea werneckii]
MVRPPAVGAAPDDHAEDGEDEDDELLNLEQQVGGTVDEIADDSSEDEVPQPNGRPRIIDRFRLNELWTLPGLGTKRYGIETYEDSQSQFTVSVWDSTLSATRPHFSVTLYCGSAATFSAEALFRCLNKGLLRKQPWTLDVKRGFDSLPQAHLHHGLHRLGVQPPDTEELRVRNLRFWPRIADEIHTLASLWATEDSVSSQLECIPSATISIDSPLWRGTGTQFDEFTLALVTLRVKSPRTLTLHTHGLFSHDLFFEALQLVDLTTNRVLPQHPYEDSERQVLSHDDSWSTSASLGLSNHADVHSRLRRLEVLEPEQSVQWRWNASSYWELRKGRGELIDGHQYALRANPDVLLKAVRWTYGKPGALEICGRPPMPVSLESEVRFTVHKVRAQRSFEEWFYSIP